MNAQEEGQHFKKLIDKVVMEKLTDYDTIHKRLKVFFEDTLKMNYLIDKSVDVNYFIGESYGLHAKGTYFANRRIYNVADSLHTKGYELAKKGKNTILQILHLNKLGALYKRTEQVRISIDFYLKSLELAEKSQDSSYQFLANFGRTKNSIGSVYLILQRYEKSISFFKEAIEIQNKIDNKHRLAVNHQNIGQALEDQGQLEEALIYYKKGLAYDEAINSDFGRIISHNSIAQIYIKQGKNNEAESLLTPLISKIRKTEFPHYITRIILNNGWVQLKQKNFNVAERHLLEGLGIASEYKLQKYIVKAYILLSELEVEKGNFEKALLFYRKGKEQHDKVINYQNNRYIDGLEFKYDTEKKDKELAEQKLAIETKELELQKKKSQNTLMTGLAIFLLLTSILTWFLHQQRQKHKNQEIITLKREQQVKTLESLMEGEEKERMRIAKELHDGVNVDLSAIKYKLTSLLEKNNKVINEAVAMIDKSCEQVRAISHNLIPPALKDFSLIEALQDYSSTANNIHKPEISFQHIGDPINITKKAEVNIFRIVQELVNNSIKHAEATEIDVQISNRANIIQITVEDNGKGFIKEKVLSNGIGLQNIQSRVDYLNAKLDFNSGKEGTSYIIDVNIDAIT